MNVALASAIYEGTIKHRRHRPRDHAFTYRIAQIFLDLDEVDAVFENRWLWSVNRRNLAEFRRSDYLGPSDLPLAQAVKQRVLNACGDALTGPIRMLTHLRYAGYVFNPVTFYYCYASDRTTLSHVVAEITNTPWRERHAYVLPLSQATQRGRTLHWSFDKCFHVSPFMGMQRQYRWSITPPDVGLHIYMNVLDGEDREFDASLALQRRELNTASMARLLLRYPLMTAQVIGAIHWESLRLWLKRVPVHNHPTRAIGRGRING